MEHHAQSVEDHLVEGLSFKLRPGASYVTDRKSVTYFPQGGNTYSPRGVRVIKIMLTGDQWLDPSTVKLSYMLKNKGTGNLRPFVVGGHGFFRRFRAIIGGQVVEDCDHWNRVTEMFHMFMDPNRRSNDAIEGFGGADTATPDVLASEAERTVMFTPLSGILNQDKYLPIRYAPIQLEFELVNSASDACRFETSAAASQDFEINDVQLKCDVITLDNALDNEYAQHLLSGKSLPINFSSYYTGVQVSTGGSDNTVNVSRALTRMKSVFVSMFKSQTADPTQATSLHEVNTFWHQSGGSHNSGQYAKFEMQIGSKKFPEYPISSTAEAFYQLRKTLGIHSSAFHTIDVDKNSYIASKFVIGVDTEKVLGASFTGFNSKAGDLLTLKLTNTGLAQNDRIFYTLHYDAILSVRDSGIEILE